MRKIVLTILCIAFFGSCFAQDQSFQTIYDRFTSLSVNSPEGAAVYRAMTTGGAVDLNRNLAIFEQENLASYIEWYISCIFENPDDQNLWIALGHAYYNSGKFHYAIQCYSVAILLAPAAASYYLYRANAFAMTGNASEALIDVTQSASLGDVNAQQLLRTVS